MAGEALLFGLVALLAIGAPLVLYLLVSEETRDTTVTNREEGERMARRDTREDR